MLKLEPRPQPSKVWSFGSPILALVITVMSTELGFLQRNLGLTPLTRDQWLTCIGFAILLLLVEEVIKFFLRRRQPAAPALRKPTLGNHPGPGCATLSSADSALPLP